jgi:divalent metal cation (Fe/Co/Zn/Cd) transporter
VGQAAELVQPRGPGAGLDLPGDQEQRLRDVVADADGVTRIVDFRTVFVGPGELLVTADVAFDSDLDTATIDERISGIETALAESEPQVRKVYIEPKRLAAGSASAI